MSAARRVLCPAPLCCDLALLTFLASGTRFGARHSSNAAQRTPRLSALALSMHSLLGAPSAGLLQANYRAQGQAALNQRQAAVQQLLSQVRGRDNRDTGRRERGEGARRVGGRSTAGSLIELARLTRLTHVSDLHSLCLCVPLQLLSSACAPLSALSLVSLRRVQRQLPATGWSSLLIQSFLSDVAAMDSNNFAESVGVGEREGRVVSELVRERHMHLSHGIGRSGDLLAQQPKAVGSSLLHALTHALTLHAVKLAGLPEARQVLLLPVATGMSIVMTLLAIKQNHPAHIKQQKEATAYAQTIAAMAASAASATASSTADSSAAPLSLPSPPPASVAPSFVIWSRIDQKTCLKSILAAGCVPLVVELLPDPSGESDELVTDVGAIERLLVQLGSDRVVAVVSTSSCFAPRAPDRVVEVSRLCAKYNVAHVVNHAYGLQCARTNLELTRAIRKGGRIDALIASMDKNFMVPVGGAIVVGFHNAHANDPTEAAKKQKQAAMHQAAKTKQRAAVEAAAAAAAAAVAGKHESAAAASSSVAAASAGSIVPSSPASAAPGSACPSSADAAAAAAPASSAAVSGAAAAPSSSASVPAAAANSASSALPDVLHLISALYPGRASATPMIDLFLTLVGLGVSGWTALLRRREELVPVLRQRLGELAASKGERMLCTPSNTISMAMTLDRLEPEAVEQINAKSAAATAAAAPGLASSSSSSSLSSASTHAPSSAASSSGSGSSPRPFTPSYLGSLLFSRHVSGPRVLGRAPPASSIGGIRFEGYGTHSGGSSNTGSGGKAGSGSGSAYPHAYVTAACSIGMGAEEVDLFVARLDKCIGEFHKQKDKQQHSGGTGAGRATSSSTSSVQPYHKAMAAAAGTSPPSCSSTPQS